MATFLALLFAALAISSFVAALVHTCAFRWCGIGIVEVRIGFWKPVWHLHAGAVSVAISPWLIGSAVRAKSVADDAPLRIIPGGDVETIAPWLSASIHVAPFLMMLFLLSATPFADLQTAVSIPAHALQGALAPLSVAQPMIADYVSMAATSPLEALCRLLLVLSVWNLLPLPPLAGGHALMMLAVGRVAAWPTWALRMMSAGVAVMLMLYVLWAYALIRTIF